MRNSLVFHRPTSFNVPKAYSQNGTSGLSGHQGRSVTVNLGGITLNVPQAQNMDVHSLAARIAEIVGREVQKSASAAFSDGVY